LFGSLEGKRGKGLGEWGIDGKEGECL